MHVLWTLLIAAMPSVQDTVLTPASVQAASRVVRTIDPADTNFSDLDHLEKSLVDARVVVLGESHNDGATLQAKNRLIRYLHERMDFDVLVIEQDMLGVREDYRQLVSGISPGQLRGPLGRFSDGDRSWLWRYVAQQAKGPRPLHLSGMDPSWFTRLLSTQFGPDLIAFFDKAGPNLLSADLRALLQGAIGYPYLSDTREMTPGRFRPAPPDTALAAKDEATLRALLTTISNKRTVLGRAHGQLEVRFTEMGLENRILHLRLHQDRQQPRRSNVVLGARDSLMGRGVAFLVNEYYKGKKVIISAGSHHTMMNGEELGVAGYDNLMTYLRRAVPTGVYSVGFIAHEGVSGPAPGYATPIDSTRHGSLEWAASQLPADFLWIDLQRLAGRYRSKLFNTQPVAAWKRHFDYAFFIKRERTLTTQ